MLNNTIGETLVKHIQIIQAELKLLGFFFGFFLSSRLSGQSREQNLLDFLLEEVTKTLM